MADFQEYYNLDISQLGKELSYKRAGILCSQLPLGSRVMRETNPNYGWSDTTKMLSLIDYDLRVLPAVLFGKKHDIEKVPKPITPTNKREEEEKRKAEEAQRMEIDGMELQPVSKEELKQMFGY